VAPARSGNVDFSRARDALTIPPLAKRPYAMSLGADPGKRNPADRETPTDPGPAAPGTRPGSKKPADSPNAALRPCFLQSGRPDLNREREL
jgi:hypothetical protein